MDLLEYRAPLATLAQLAARASRGYKAYRVRKAFKVQQAATGLWGRKGRWEITEHRARWVHKGLRASVAKLARKGLLDRRETLGQKDPRVLKATQGPRV